MISIHELLNKIKWDKDLNPQEYKLYYLDRITNSLKEIKFAQIKEFSVFSLIVEKNSNDIDIPLHRIKEVRKTGKIIWKR